MSNLTKLPYTTIAQHIDMSGVVFTENLDDVESWGGAWSFTRATSPNCHMMGYTSKTTAVYAWMEEEFGETGTQTIIRLIQENGLLKTVLKQSA